MNAMQLKTAVCEEIDRRSEEIKEIGRFILKNPELGYREQKTSAYIRGLFDREHIPYDTYALTGVRARVGTGINIAVLA
ncbi:MAG: amidohydrolase, partial [Oscillospiraceae bacterium]|nr:amidohydrolase [Oscillospiraceae bacterium]